MLKAVRGENITLGRLTRITEILTATRIIASNTSGLNAPDTGQRVTCLRPTVFFIRKYS